MSSAPCLADTDCTHLELDGDGNLSVEVVISSDDGNTLECRANGLYGSQAPVPESVALPSTPSDGQMFVYEFDAFTQWLFRYDSDEASAYKWKFIGGPGALSRVEAEVDIVSPDGSLVWGFAAGPQLTLPFAGYYRTRFGAAIDASQDGFVAQVGVAKQGDDPGNDDIAENAAGHIASVSSEMVLPADGSPYALPNTVVRLYRRSDGDGSGTARFVHRWMEVIPLKVGP